MRSHTYSTTVKWVDTDASTRIHNTAAFRWAEAAEHSLYQLIVPELGVGPFPRRTVSATYHRAFEFRDPVEVMLKVARLGNSSIGYEWEIRRDGELYIEGNHVAIFVDDTGRPAALPDALRAGLAAELVSADVD